MNTPHKYADVIKAWADGKPIQWRIDEESDWKDFNFTNTYYRYPGWNNHEWRIKPEKKTGWIFIQTNNSPVRTKSNSVHYPNQFIYETHDEAMQAFQNNYMSDVVACIQIEYEEGQGL